MGNTRLLDLIKAGGIEFFSQGRKLELKPEDIGKYMIHRIKVWVEFYEKSFCPETVAENMLRNFGNDAITSYEFAFCKDIVEQSDGYVVMRGGKLESLLSNKKNLRQLAGFIDHLNYVSCSRHGAPGGEVLVPLHLHIDADVEKVGRKYKKEQHRIVNLLGQEAANADDWLPFMPDFDKLWHFCICNSHVETGYEYPFTEEEFWDRVLGHISYIMVGTKEQLQRYKSWPCLYKDDGKDPAYENFRSGIEGMIARFS